MITIILGASLFVEVTSRSGVFTGWQSNLQSNPGDPWRLLVFYGALTVIFSAVLNNVTAMIIAGSLIAVSLGKLDRRDLLLDDYRGSSDQCWCLLTLISSVPNIIVGQAAGISFVPFFLTAGPFVAVATLVTLFQSRFTFGVKGLVTVEERKNAAELVAGFDENESVPGAIFLVLRVTPRWVYCLPSRPIRVAMEPRRTRYGLCRPFFAGVALWFYKHEVDTFYKAVDWDLLLVFSHRFLLLFM